MSYTYKNFVPHGITFVNAEGVSKHTWNDWKIVPTSRPVFLPPSAKTVTVNIPGADGILDLTESLAGEVRYDNRIGSIEFLVENRDSWFNVYSDILDFMQGNQLKAVLEDEPSFYYTGRFSVNDWKSEQYRSKIVIDYNVEPYKMEISSSLEDWEWDAFSFETGIIREYKDLRVDESLTFVVEGRRKSVIPSFTVVSDNGLGLKVNFNGNTYNLPDGTTKITNIVTSNAHNTFIFTGRGWVSIDYRGGRL